MAEKTTNILSEQTKDMTPEAIAELQEKTSKMSAKKLKEYRNSMNADDMGFSGEECI